MSLIKQFEIKETVTELRKLQKSSIPMIANRLRALIEFKKNEDVGISKRDVADMIRVNHNSVQSWRNLYIQGGIKRITSKSWGLNQKKIHLA